MTSTDTRWYRRVHAEIYDYATAVGRIDKFWFLEDQRSGGIIDLDDYYAALVDLLAADA